MKIETTFVRYRNRAEEDQEIVAEMGERGWRLAGTGLWRGSFLVFQREAPETRKDRVRELVRREILMGKDGEE